MGALSRILAGVGAQLGVLGCGGIARPHINSLGAVQGNQPIRVSRNTAKRRDVRSRAGRRKSWQRSARYLVVARRENRVQGWWAGVRTVGRHSINEVWVVASTERSANSGRTTRRQRRAGHAVVD